MSPVPSHQPQSESRAPIDQRAVSRSKVTQKKNGPLAQPAVTENQIASVAPTEDKSFSQFWRLEVRDPCAEVLHGPSSHMSENSGLFSTV